MEPEEDWPALATAQQLKIAALEKELDEARALACQWYPYVREKWAKASNVGDVNMVITQHEAVFPWLKRAL